MMIGDRSHAAWPPIGKVGNHLPPYSPSFFNSSFTAFTFSVAKACSLVEVPLVLMASMITSPMRSRACPTALMNGRSRG